MLTLVRDLHHHQILRLLLYDLQTKLQSVCLWPLLHSPSSITLQSLRAYLNIYHHKMYVVWLSTGQRWWKNLVRVTTIQKLGLFFVNRSIYVSESLQLVSFDL